MNPVYLINPPPSPFPLIEPNEDQHLQLFSPSSEASSSCLSNSIFFNPAYEQGGSYDTEEHQQQEEVKKYALQDGSSDDHHGFLQSPSLPTVENGLNNSLEVSVSERDDGDHGNQGNSGGPVKWMSSKMRLMRKMMKFQDRHHQQQPPSPLLDTDNSSNNSSNNNNNTVRVCSDCNTTKTPLWRSGPRGPKSLCNACGIRQRKARRAMAAAAAAAAASGAVLVNRPKVQHKEKRSDKGYVQKYKKRCKLTDPCSRKKKLCFEEFTINLSKNLDFHQVFPQDEKEAAILLMALSCGLVHS
ncbi:GATA transcription factor 21-like [Macadamia integrifolia]|uniref:GATA transcription factor 21-like n=1 Tax=Macadamia integrifolia TaxID=60698 RepID=UPI001C4E6B0F|nr:GATA transcription factor 21-like [Macadamia integrifolia]